MPTTAVLKLPAAAIGMPRESGPPGPAQESLLGSEEAAPELNAFEAFRAGWNPVLKLAGHNILSSWALGSFSFSVEAIYCIVLLGVINVWNWMALSRLIQPWCVFLYCMFTSRSTSSFSFH